MLHSHLKRENKQNQTCETVCSCSSSGLSKQNLRDDKKMYYAIQCHIRVTIIRDQDFVFSSFELVARTAI